VDSSNNDRLQSLFEEALSLPLESRDAFLRERCGSDAELLQRLRRMLEPDRTGELSALVDLARQSTDLLDERPETASRAGETVGAYRLVRSIGSGTFGEVFLAEQAEPVVRQVAVKVLHAGMNSAEVVRRFRAEQQSLARMDHPNIAKVYDAGVTERGLPYFVMQYVPGEPITEYCDRRRLSIDERLRLFRRVCEAVEHAHIKSVVHRDLKPSNVLVTSTEGGGPEPMVIDFGVAKVIAEGEHTETAHRTEAGLAVGTWAYMSPEQAAGDPDVDTRSDVYSLGVMLYELLCGAKPFEGETLRNAAEAELRRMIREDEPPRPSDRLRSDGTAPSSAAARKTGVSELSPPAALGAGVDPAVRDAEGPRAAIPACRGAWG
jgi:serine/threonine protein kinase